MKTLDDYLWTYFFSGANDAGDMLGLIDCSMDWGCSVNEIRPGWELGVQYTLDTDVLSFWDSGAFGEFRHPEFPITYEDWLKRLAIYRWVAERLEGQAFLVAPDKVAYQAETLERLETHSETIRACRRDGAQIIVPHQGGALSLPDFTATVVDLLGFDDFVVGFPMREGVTAVETVQGYCDEMQPPRVHLLGIGPRARKRPKLITVIQAIDEVSPDTDIYCDSVGLLGMRGKTGSAKAKTRKIRPLKAAQDRALELLRERLHGAPPESITYEEAIEDPRRFVGHVRWRLLVEGWAEQGLIPIDLIDYGLTDPAGLLQREDLYDNPTVRRELDTEWRLVTNSRASQIWKRREGIRRVLCPEAYDPGVTEAEAKVVLTGPPRVKRRR